ncbi:hypothetical protein EVAR_43430_1 [Eumeta japonica]|uniref:Uncharacterized protein n=1 Tax=Eumeta variegata TaxID=151549 RepID=A0A4C1WWR2_EUMVA|nr:hypothetical protein EVAR_43430_1 [Eumeta japonica]
MHWRGGVVIEREGMRERKERGRKRKSPPLEARLSAPRGAQLVLTKLFVEFLKAVMRLRMDEFFRNTFSRWRTGHSGGKKVRKEKSESQTKEKKVGKTKGIGKGKAFEKGKGKGNDCKENVKRRPLQDDDLESDVNLTS